MFASTTGTNAALSGSQPEMKVAYVDMIGGAAGDMLMGAWVDAGVDVRELEHALRSVVAEGWELVTERVDRAGVSAIHLDLVIPGEDDHAHAPDGAHQHAHAHHGHRLRDILAIVERSGLPARAIENATAIYRRLATAEARVFGENADEMFFHAVGAIDAILDVAGTCVALELLGIEELRVSAFPLGHGRSRSGHENPGPGVLDLVRGFPVREVDVEAQLVTETGAAILTTLASPGPPFTMRPERSGYGAGRKTFAFPNVVCVTIGQSLE